MKQPAITTQPKEKRSILLSLKSFFSPAQSFHYRDLASHLKEISRQEILRQYLPFLSILSDRKTIFTKNHTLVRVIKITGIDSGNISSELQQEFANIRNNFFSLVRPEVRLSFYTIRRPIPESNHEENLFKNSYAEKISETWHSQFRNSFVSETYLIISKNFPDLIKNLTQFKAKLNAARKDFELVAEQIKNLLAKFAPIDLDNKKNNELFRFFSYIINSCEFNFKSESDLFSHLSLSDISFNANSGLMKIENDKCSKYSKIIGVRVSSAGLKRYSDEKLISTLLTLNHEFTVVQQVEPYTKEQNRKYFVSKIKSLEQMPRFSAIQSRIDELYEALELLESNQTNFLDYTCYIKTFGESEDKLRDAVAEILNSLASEGISAASETIGAESAFFSLLPDLESTLTLLPTSIRSRISTQNTADFVSLSATKEGFRRSPFGEMPVVDFKTLAISSLSVNSNGNYSFTFHQDDISDRASGHTMIIGQTGTGKSTLAAFLLMNCLKFQDIKILCFDSLQGLKLPVTAFDGKYITVGKDTDLKINPMRLPDSFTNRNFQKRFIEMLAKQVEEKENQIVEEVLRQNYTLDEEDRCLANLKPAFDLEGFDEVTKRPNIASRIKKWVGAGQGVDNNDEIYARFFNNSEDNLDFKSNIVAFDMGDVLKDQDLLAPTAFYIFHKFNQIIEENPSPHVFFIDEMQKYLQSPQFNPHIISTIKESRKRNGIFIGCMQEASTLVDSPNGDEIISNLATLIIFPNSQARPEHYIDGLNLTDSEFDFIKNHPNPRHVLIKKKDGHSVIVDADLAILGKYLKLFSSKDTDRKLMEELLTGDGEKDCWIEKFLEAQA